jgi:two-component sensor histidine kinase
MGLRLSVTTLARRPEQRRRWIVWIVCLYAVGTLGLLPVAGVKGPELPASTGFMVAGILTTEFATSFLLFVWFIEARSWSLLLLACAYLYSGSMAVAHLLTFPEAIVPGRILMGGPQSASWTYLLWTDGYAAITLAATIVESWASQRRISRTDIGIAIGVGCTAVLAITLGGLVTAIIGADRLPPVLQGSSFTNLAQMVRDVGLAMMICSIVLVLGVIGRRSMLFLWLVVALTAMLASNILASAGGGRYTVGWSVGRLSWMLSAGALFLFFMGRFVRQQWFLSSARATLEQRVRERTADLTETIKQRDLLLREVYHRVRNNLQIVDSLLMMESRRLEDPTAKDALAELRNRVFTLGLVHQQLMSSGNLKTFSIAPFLSELCDNVAASYGAAARGVRITVSAEPVTVDLDFAIPVGLLATELLSNAIKHAHAQTITIVFSQCKAGRARLVVGDDGNNAEVGLTRFAACAGVGSRIIDGLTRQIGGRMNIVQQEGMRVEISMPLPEAA